MVTAFLAEKRLGLDERGEDKVFGMLDLGAKVCLKR